MARIRLTNTEEGHSKFWEGILEGSEVTTKWGKLGTDGQSKTKDFGSEDAAKKEYDKLVKEKKGKGYVEEPGAKAPAAAKPAAAAKAVAPKTAAKPAAAPAKAAPAKAAPAKAGKREEISLENTEEGHSKFWKGILEGTSVTTVWGKIGTDGQSKTKDFGSADAAKKEYDKLVKEKTGKGYVKAGEGGGDDDEGSDEDEDYGDDDEDMDDED